MRFDLDRRPASVMDFLQRHDASAGLLPTAERLLRLREDLFAGMPPSLQASCDVTGCDDSTVVLSVASASAAAKLRQTLPRLKAKLSARGWRIEGIRIRVRPRLYDGEPPRKAPSNQAMIPVEAIAAFEDLGRRLDDSPLRTAVERLVSRRSRT